MASTPTPLDEDIDLLSFTVLLEDETTVEAETVEIVKTINKIPTAKISIPDGSVSKGDFTTSESDILAPGNSIEIKAGYHSDETTIFKGIIMSQTIKTYPEEASLLVLDCSDIAVKMTLGRSNVYYNDVTDKDVITQILGNYDLSDTSVEDTEVEYKELLQYYANDWDFIVSRAEINGKFIIIDDGSVAVKEPGTDDSPVLEVNYSESIIESEITMSSKEQMVSIQASSWDLSTQTVLKSSSPDSESSSVDSAIDQGDITGSTLAEVMNVSNYNLQSSVPLGEDSLQQWSDAQLLKSRINRFQGTLSFQGNALPKPDTTITVEGLGDHINGTAYVTSVRHEIHPGSWITEVGFGLPEKWYAEQMETSPPKAGGMLPGVNGLQVGVVKQIDSDEENEYRVLVTLPLISDSDTGIWARLSTFYASQGFGAFFYPEVGDEVILGFLDDNPTYPVILGSLYSKARTPYASLTPDSTNSKKAIVTSSELQLSFDDENKIITILTPGGNTVTLSDQDSSITVTDLNGNSAEFNSSGITVTSKGALTLKATDSVSIEGSTVSIKASSGSLDAEGTGVTVKSSGSLSLEGSSTELKASGTVSVSGSTVSLN